MTTPTTHTTASNREAVGDLAKEKSDFYGVGSGPVRRFPKVYSRSGVKLYVPEDGVTDEIFVSLHGVLRRLTKDEVFTPVPHESGFHIDVAAHQEGD